MTTITLQKKLIKKISETDNISILKFIESLLKVDKKSAPLTDLQKKLMNQSVEQFNNGEFIEHTQLMDKLSIKYGF
jgi:hypothetical protein